MKVRLNEKKIKSRHSTPFLYPDKNCLIELLFTDTKSEIVSQQSPLTNVVRLLWCWLYTSAISSAANHCLTAHARISSGATNVQNISLSLLKSALHPHSPAGGILEWMATHTHKKVVEQHVYTTCMSDRFDEQPTVGREASEVFESGVARLP